MQWCFCILISDWSKAHNDNSDDYNSNSVVVLIHYHFCSNSSFTGICMLDTLHNPSLIIKKQEKTYLANNIYLTNCMYTWSYGQYRTEDFVFRFLCNMTNCISFVSLTSRRKKGGVEKMAVYSCYNVSKTLSKAQGHLCCNV